MSKYRVAVSYSGGIDSTVLAYDAVSSYGKDRVVLINVFVGRPTDVMAQKNISFHSKKLGVLAVSVPLQVPKCVKGRSNIFLGSPNRKAHDVSDDPGSDYALSQEVLLDDYAPGLYTMLWCVVGAKAIELGCDTVLTGCYTSPVHNVYTDTDSRFMDTLNLHGTQIWGRDAPEFRSPLLTKEDTVSLGKELGVDFSKTHSCSFVPACGVCLECIVRKEVLCE